MIADIREAVEFEQIGWAFIVAGDTRDEDSRDTSRKGRKTTDEMRRFAAHPDPAVRANIAKRKGCSAEMLALLAESAASDDSLDVYRAVISHPNCPSDIVDDLIAKEPELAYYGTLNPHLAESVARDILDNQPGQIAALALAKGCTADTLREIADRAEYELPPNPTTQEISDHSVSVRSLIPALLNPNCPPDLCSRFSTHAHHEVRAAAARGAEMPDLVRLYEERNQKVRAGVAENPLATPEMLTYLAVAGDATVRIKVAQNPNTPESVVRNLTDNLSKKVATRATNALARRVS